MGCQLQLICVWDWRERTGKEPCFECSDQKSQGDDSSRVLHAGEADGKRSPGKKEDTKPSRRPNVMLHDEVAGDFEDRVGDGEEGDGQRVAV